jgi:hypothetical protein
MQHVSYVQWAICSNATISAYWMFNMQHSTGSYTFLLPHATYFVDPRRIVSGVELVRSGQWSSVWVMRITCCGERPARLSMTTRKATQTIIQLLIDYDNNTWSLHMSRGPYICETGRIRTWAADLLLHSYNNLLQSFNIDSILLKYVGKVWCTVEHLGWTGR